MAVWVLILYGIYFALAFGARVWIHRRATGSTGIVKLPQKRFSVAWVATMALGIGALLGLAAPFLELAGLSRPVAALDSALGHAAGSGMFAVGLAIMFQSQLTMGESWRIGVDPNEQTKLVTRGTFSFVRNPIYSAGALMSLGLILIMPDPLLIVSLLVQAVGVEIQVRGVEEPFLKKNHHSQYATYASRVGRFMPLIGRIRNQPLR